MLVCLWRAQKPPTYGFCSSINPLPSEGLKPRQSAFALLHKEPLSGMCDRVLRPLKTGSFSTLIDFSHLQVLRSPDHQRSSNFYMHTVLELGQNSKTIHRTKTSFKVILTKIK